MKKRLIEWMIDRLERKIYRLEDKVERLRWKLPRQTRPTEPGAAQMAWDDAERLSKHMVESGAFDQPPYLNLLQRNEDNQSPFF